MLDGLSPKLWLGRDQKSLSLFAQMLQLKTQRDYSLEIVCDLYDRADKMRNAQETELFYALTNNIFRERIRLPEGLGLDSDGFWHRYEEDNIKRQTVFRKFVFHSVRAPRSLLRALAKGQPSFVQVYEEERKILDQDLFWASADGNMKETLKFFTPRFGKKDMEWLFTNESLAKMIVMNPKEATPFIERLAGGLFHDQTWLQNVIEENHDVIDALPFELRINQDFMLSALRAKAPVNLALHDLANRSKMGFILDAMAINSEAISRVQSPLSSNKEFIEKVVNFHKHALFLNGVVLNNALREGLLSLEELLWLVRRRPEQFGDVADYAFTAKKGIFEYIVSNEPSILRYIHHAVIYRNYIKLVDLIKENIQIYQHVPNGIREDEDFIFALREIGVNL